MSGNVITPSFLFKNKYARIVEFFLRNPSGEFYVNQILGKTGISPQVLCESLKELEQIGVLTREKRANSIYYMLNSKSELVGKLKKMIKPLTYKDAGVDIDSSNESVDRIKRLVRQTYNANVLSDVGSFGGLYKLDDEDVLVSSTDGVGTKLKLAFWTGRHDTIGQDLVNHCVNDILVMGAKPLFFLDYIGSGKVKPDVIEGIVKGLSIACKENGCALVGGEIAEMPGLYKENEYDLASFIVGKVKRRGIIDGSKVKAGDVVIGLPSSGLHTNGYSLVFRVLFDHAKMKLKDKPKGLGCSLKEELMKVHTSYLKPISELMEKFEIKAMAHITGGGLVENIPRVIPKRISVEIEKGSWNVPPIFKLIQELGSVNEGEMFRVFNMGIGFVVIVDRESMNGTLKTLSGHGLVSQVIGRAVNGSGKVILK